MRHLTLWNDTHLSPWRSLSDLQRNFDRFFETSESKLPSEVGFNPACEIEETDNHYLMSVDLPGVAKKDINIEVKDGELTVFGERKSEKKSKGFSERFHGKFQRTFILPLGVDNDKIEARYEDGVLTLAVPKAEEVKPRQIKIGEGKGSFFEKFLGGTKEQSKEANTSSAA